MPQSQHRDDYHFLSPAVRIEASSSGCSDGFGPDLERLVAQLRTATPSALVPHPVRQIVLSATKGANIDLMMFQGLPVE